MTDTTNPADGTGVSSYMQGQITNPTLSPQATDIPILQNVQNDEVMSGQSSTLNPTGANANPLTPVETPTVNQTAANASQVDQNNATNGLTQNGNQYQAATLGNNAAQTTAAQMSVNPLDTVSGQLTQLYSQAAIGQLPPWARGAVQQANDVLASRGLGSSTIGAAAVAAAMQQSALQIAVPDANTYFQANLNNFNATQQTNLANLQNRQQALLTDQAAENASAQFNATSANQMQQFMSSLVTSILSQNADRMTAISQFNSGQANTIAATNASNQIQTGEFNNQQLAAMEQFNSSIQNQRDQFNAQNAFAVEQSNVTWRRNINTANTAAVNAANQTNVQNSFNLSATALNNVWQQFRDESSWIFQASQNQNIMNFNAAMAANNQGFVLQQQSTAQNAAWMTAIGQFAGSLLVGS